MANLSLPLVMIVLGAHFLFAFGTWAFNSSLPGADSGSLTNPSTLLDPDPESEDQCENASSGDGDEDQDLPQTSWLNGTPFHPMVQTFEAVNCLLAGGLSNFVSQLTSGVGNMALFVVRFFTMDYDVLKADGILGILAWVFIRAPLMVMLLIAVFQFMLNRASRGFL